MTQQNLVKVSLLSKNPPCNPPQLSSTFSSYDELKRRVTNERKKVAFEGFLFFFFVKNFVEKLILHKKFITLIPECLFSFFSVHYYFYLFIFLGYIIVV